MTEALGNATALPDAGVMIALWPTFKRARGDFH
jgi:hypothetical protein